MKERLFKTECAVIGGGFAGLSAALELADAGKKVDLFVKGGLEQDCNSYLCAGGLAAVPETGGDSHSLHVRDTLKAGKYLNDREVVKYCVEHFYSDVICWLVKKGVHFDSELHMEGGHSKNRIFHVSDTTGVSVMGVLTGLAKKHRNINVHENYMALDLITRKKIGLLSGRDRVLGFYVLDADSGAVKTVAAGSVFVCTGGLGKVFTYTSNPDIATADGFAMCYRAGMTLNNMEFIQFHPTVYYDPSAPNEFSRRFLLTEALRGAGAFIKIDKNAKDDFVKKYDRQGSQSTRDVVTKAEDIEMRRLGLNNVWLDCTKVGVEKLIKEFKNSYEFCLGKGIDISKEPIPVVYAEHYSNGGVSAGRHSETEISGCYVIGETSYTGLHGATRLASNSAPECILYGRLAASHYIKYGTPEFEDIPLWVPGRATRIKDLATISYYWDMVRRTMTSLCGISRNEARLTAAKNVLAELNKNIKEYYWNYKVTKNFLEVRNIAAVASIIVESALARKESRACHFREDYPGEDAQYRKVTAIKKKKIYLNFRSGDEKWKDWSIFRSTLRAVRMCWI